MKRDLPNLTADDVGRMVLEDLRASGDKKALDRVPPLVISTSTLDASATAALRLARMHTTPGIVLIDPLLIGQRKPRN